MAEKVLTGVARLSEAGFEPEVKIYTCLNAIRCLPAFRELNNMAVTDVVQQKAAESMELGLTTIHSSSQMLPGPERHNRCEDHDELAELNRSFAEVLAARSRLDQDPFRTVALKTPANCSYLWSR